MALDAVQTAFLILVQRFAERQKLVFAVMEELRPDKLMFVRMHEQPERPTEEEYRAYLEYAKWFATMPQAGYWGKNNEWRYFFHGGGCRITHVVTGEPIDWEAPDVNRLDRFFFADYLKWVFRQNSPDPAAATVQAAYANYDGKVKHFAYSILEQLVRAGYLTTDDEQITYALASITFARN
jgi:hypothetical protein